MGNVQEFNRLDDFCSLEESWRRLTDQTPLANFFQTWEWLTTYWEHLPDDRRMRVFVVEKDGTAVGMLPMVVCPESRGVGTMQVFTLPLDSWGTLFTPLGPSPQQTLQTVLDHLHSRRRDWDILSLRWLDERPGQLDVAVALAKTGWRTQVVKENRGVLIDCRTDWQTYWDSRSKKWRSNVGRLRRKLTRDFAEPEIRRWRGDLSHAERDCVWEDCQRVARSSWQAESGKGVPLCSETHLPFLKRLHDVACSAGFIDVVLMYVDEQPVAYGYNFVYRRNVSGFRMGYDQAFRQYGVGMQLAVFTLEDSFRRDDEWFDFGIDFLDYKRQLETDEYVTREYEHYAPTSLRGQLLRCKHALEGWWSPHSESTT